MIELATKMYSCNFNSGIAINHRKRWMNTTRLKTLKRLPVQIYPINPFKLSIPQQMNLSQVIAQNILSPCTHFMANGFPSSDRIPPIESPPVGSHYCCLPTDSWRMKSNPYISTPLDTKRSCHDPPSPDRCILIGSCGDPTWPQLTFYKGKGRKFGPV